MTPACRIEALPAGFDRWSELLALIRDAFAYMDGVIDPPSSATRLTLDSLRRKADSEHCLVAVTGSELIGCVFAEEKSDRIYIGKLCVTHSRQGRGIGRAMLGEVEGLAQRLGKPVIELQTRVELTANQLAFARLGFCEVARTAHAGYDRPTSITLRKHLT